jgi:uncharacterized integral membrane protein (TIGR00698 family)
MTQAEARPAEGQEPIGTAARIARLVPGVALAVAIAVVAYVASAILPFPVGAAPTGLVLGLLIGAAAVVPRAADVGVRFAAQQFLRVGIVLLGARISLQAVIDLGILPLVLIGLTMTTAFSVSVLAARRLGVGRRLGILLGVGNAVCGNTAIAATAPIVRAEREETAAAVAVVTAFGTAAVLSFPVLGAWAALPPVIFGIWCGIAINDTSQVLAAASAFSPVALQVATVTKFIRNAMLAPVIVGVSLFELRSVPRSVGGTAALIGTSIPPFVVGFLVLAVLNSIGLIPSAVADPLGQASTWLILIALVAIGLGTDLGSVRRLGKGPAIAGLGTAAVVAAVTLILLIWLGPAIAA